MTSTFTAESINIRPGVSILSVLRHLNYKPWFALAEFVDNSLQSYLDHREQIEQTEGPDFKLKVEIEFDSQDEGRIVIRDNAAGIHQADYARAFRPAEVPPKSTGLSEFGMGMKSAACWFAPRWSVRTSALGEPVERTVKFDISKIVQDKLEELDVRVSPVDCRTHYTEVILSHLHNKPQGRTVSKIKEHLASIYRVFLKAGLIRIRFNNDFLSYHDPEILVASYYKDAAGESKRWCKEIDIDLGLGMRAYGFAAIRKVGSTTDAGLALFRRDRLIEGSADEGYRPEIIFGKSNSFTYQRLFGELHLEGFEVSHTKDGIRWEEHEDVFLQLLKEDLNVAPLPLLDQAEGYRARLRREDLARGAEIAADRTAGVIEREVPPVLEQQIGSEPEAQNPPQDLPAAEMNLSTRQIPVELHGHKWLINLELNNDPSVGDWLSLSDQGPVENTGDGVRHLNVRLSLAHPFMVRFGGVEPVRIEPLLRVAAAIALAETTARASGVKAAGTIRRNVNELLRDAFSKP